MREFTPCAMLRSSCAPCSTRRPLSRSRAARDRRPTRGAEARLNWRRPGNVRRRTRHGWGRLPGWGWRRSRPRFHQWIKIEVAQEHVTFFAHYRRVDVFDSMYWTAKEHGPIRQAQGWLDRQNPVWERVCAGRSRPARTRCWTGGAWCQAAGSLNQWSQRSWRSSPELSSKAARKSFGSATSNVKSSM